jgi:hypothetical protein
MMLSAFCFASLTECNRFCRVLGKIMMKMDSDYKVQRVGEHTIMIGAGA